MRKKPVSAITIFLPTTEVKNCDHFIMSEGLKNLRKVKPRLSEKCKELSGLHRQALIQLVINFAEQVIGLIGTPV